MLRIKKRKALIFIVLTLGLVGYFLVFIGGDLMSEAAFNEEHRMGWNLMTPKPPISPSSSNIHGQRLTQIKLSDQHDILVKKSEPPTERLIRWQLYHQLPPRDVSELGHRSVANIVFYIWCENRTFEYRHYLSVRSIWKYLEPETLEIHYKSKPKQDKYNDWLDALKDSIANLVLKKLPDWVDCDPCHNYVRDYLHERGGIYVADDTVILDSLQGFMNKKLTVFYGVEDVPKLIISSARNSDLRGLNCYSKSDAFKKFASGHNGTTRRCQEIITVPLNATNSEKDCVFLSGSVLPKDIFTATDIVTAGLREIAYGDREPIKTFKDETKIPKIVHYIWYNRANMTFVMYLSILSSLNVIKADRIFIHGGSSLEGHYWEKIKVNPRVQTVDRDVAYEVFGNRVLYTHHKSDVIRADILYKYGGIYADWDVLWLNPIDDLISTGYDVIVNYDHMPRYPFPESINMGVVLSKPRARYINFWRNTYRHYRTDDFYYNPIEVPYKIYEMYPSLVRIEPRLQVMCFQLKCHPIFHPDFKTFDESQPFDWRKEVYAIHFTYPDPEEYKNEETLENGHGMFADIGKYILKTSNR